MRFQGEKMMPKQEVKFPERRTCTRCGFIASQEICKACVLLEGLNRGIPTLGVGKSNKAKRLLGLKVGNESENKTENGRAKMKADRVKGRRSKKKKDLNKSSEPGTCIRNNAICCGGNGNCSNKDDSANLGSKSEDVESNRESDQNFDTFLQSFNLDREETSVNEESSDSLNKMLEACAIQPSVIKAKSKRVRPKFVLPEMIPKAPNHMEF